MQGSKRLLVVAAIVAVGQFGLSATSSRAANILWDGGGADSSLLTPANWVGDVLPVPADSAQFTGGLRLDPFAPSNVQYTSIFFLAGATGPFTIGGPGTIVVGSTTAGNYLNNDTVGIGHTINAPIGWVGGTVNATQGSLTFNGSFNIGNGANLAGNNVTFNTSPQGIANTITLNGPITGTGTTASVGGTLAKQGNLGTLIINGDNSAWQGRVFVNNGALRINNAGGLGTGDSAIDIAGNQNTGTLELTGNITLAKPIISRGREGTAVDVPEVRNVSGNNVINTLNTSTGGTRQNYESLAGNLRIDQWNTTGSSGARTLRVFGAGDGEISNWTAVNTNVISLIKDGTGTWTLGSNLNSSVGTFGTVTANGGTLRFNGGLGAKVGGNVVVNNGGTVFVGSSDGITGELGINVGTTTNSVQINSGGTLDASQFSTYSLQPYQTLISGGTFKVGGQLTTFGDNAVYIGNGTGAVAGTFNIQGNLVVSNAFATATGGFRFDLSNSTSGTNDLVSIAGGMSVDTSGGAIPLYINSLGGGFQTGTYRLFEFTSGATLNAGDFSIVGGSSGTTRQSFNVGTAPGQVNLVVSGSAASLVWNGTAGNNNWEVAPINNWLNGATPDRFYQFDNVNFTNAAAEKNVNLVGELTPTTITVNSTADYTFSGSGSIAGTASLTKSGTGTLILNNTIPATNTWNGPITVNAGTLQVGNGGAEGQLSTGALTNNGTVILNRSTAVVLPATSGTGNIIVRGTGGADFQGTHTYTGTTTIEAGSIAYLRSGAGLGDAAGGTTVASGGTLYSVTALTSPEPLTLNGDGTAAGIGALRGGGNALSTFTGPVTLGSSSTINVDGGATINLSNPVTGTGDLTKNGPGTLILAGATNSYSGNTTITAGTLQVGQADVAGELPAGAISVAGTLAFGSSQTIDFNRTVTGAGTIAQGNAGGTTTLSGNLTGFTGTLITNPSAAAPAAPGAPASGTLIVSVPTGATVATVNDTGGGTGQGILRLTNSNALASGAAINVFAQQTVGNGRLELGNNISVNAGLITLSQRNLVPVVDLNGLNPTTVQGLTPAIRSTDGNNTLSGNIRVGTGGNFAGVEVASGSTLTLNGTATPADGVVSPRNFVLMGAGNGTANSTIADNVQPLSVFKSGSGTWTLNGANTYTGRTGVLGGTLVVSTAARNAVLPSTPAANQFVDVMGGRVHLKYADATDGSTLTNTVGAILDAGYDQAVKWSAGQIRSTGIDSATRALGFYNNTANSQVTVGLTLYGDANVDFSVNFDDLLLLAKNYNGTGKIWGQGDYNYDTAVNFDDLLLLAKNYNQTVTPAQASVLGESFAADFALAQSLVPEPGTLSLIGLGLAGLAGRRRTATTIA